MSPEEQRLEETEISPSDYLVETLKIVRSQQTKPDTSAQSFLAHLETIGNWSGDDLEDCLEAVQSSRHEAQHSSDFNPFCP